MHLIRFPSAPKRNRIDDPETAIQRTARPPLDVLHESVTPEAFSCSARERGGSNDAGSVGKGSAVADKGCAALGVAEC